MCVSHVIFPAFAMLLPFCFCFPSMPNTNHTTLRMSFSAGWHPKTIHSSSLIVFRACGCNILRSRIRSASFHIEKHSGPGTPSRSNSETSSNDVNLDPVTCACWRFQAEVFFMCFQAQVIVQTNQGHTRQWSTRRSKHAFEDITLLISLRSLLTGPPKHCTDSCQALSNLSETFAFHGEFVQSCS